MVCSKKKKTFTLIEMLIVVVIIGILAAAVIPRLQQTQERTRDAARSTSIRDISSAINVYAQDNGGKFPLDVFRKARQAAGMGYNSSDTTLASLEKDNPLDRSVFPSAHATNTVIISTTDNLKGDLQPYIKAIPSDPHPSKGVGALEDGSCYVGGDSFGYTTDGSGKMFAITANAEAKRGNTTACKGVIDANNNGSFQVMGQGLGTAQRPTDESCFTFSNGTITNYLDDCPKDVVIPETINGEKVITIGGNTFFRKGITSVTIPSSVTSIGKYAFYRNNLTSVSIPNSVTSIEIFAFQQNQLTSVSIPNSVTSIGSQAFYMNQLTSITIPNSISSIGHAVFGRNQLTSVSIPNSVTSIGDSAFKDNQLTSVSIPNSVTSIGTTAFFNNRLTSVSIPNSVSSIGQRAFYNNGPNQNSRDITFYRNTNQTRILNGTTWVRQ